MQRKDLVGQTFGRLTVIELVGLTAQNKARWRCRCSCGNECIAITGAMRSGNTTSCGCYLKEVMEKPKKHGHALRKHRGGRSPEYGIEYDDKAFDHLNRIEEVLERGDEDGTEEME